MATNSQPLAKKPSAWRALASHYKAVSEVHLRQLFADDPERGQRLALEAVGLYLDYSKNRVTDETLKLLLQLAEESRLRARIDAMFKGEKINITEKRAVLHVALRAPKDTKILVDRENAEDHARARPDGSSPTACAVELDAAPRLGNLRQYRDRRF